MSNQALIYQAQSEYQAAIELYDAAELVLIQTGLDESLAMANTLQNLAISYKKVDDLETAEQYYDRSGELFEQLGNLEGMAQTEVNRSLMWLDSGQPEKAIPGLKNALQTCKEIGSKEGEKYASQSLSDAYQMMGLPDSAIVYFKAFHTVNDELTNETLGARIEELKVKYDTAQNEQKIASLESEKRLDDALIQRLWIILFASLAILISAFGISGEGIKS